MKINFIKHTTSVIGNTWNDNKWKFDVLVNNNKVGEITMTKNELLKGITFQDKIKDILI